MNPLTPWRASRYSRAGTVPTTSGASNGSPYATRYTGLQRVQFDLGGVPVDTQMGDSPDNTVAAVAAQAGGGKVVSNLTGEPIPGAVYVLSCRWYDVGRAGCEWWGYLPALDVVKRIRNHYPDALDVVEVAS